MIRKIVLLIVFSAGLAFGQTSSGKRAYAKLKRIVEKDILQNIKSDPDFKERAKSFKLKNFFFKDLQTSCKGSSLYLVSYHSDKMEYTVGGKKDWVPIAGFYTGSAGTVNQIWSYNRKLDKLKLLFSENLIDFYPPKNAKKDCPDFKVMLHGSSFGRVGNHYGKKNLVWNSGKYKLSKGEVH